jgi:hypothetical protein
MLSLLDNVTFASREGANFELGSGLEIKLLVARVWHRKKAVLLQNLLAQETDSNILEQLLKRSSQRDVF